MIEKLELEQLQQEAEILSDDAMIYFQGVAYWESLARLAGNDFFSFVDEKHPVRKDFERWKKIPAQIRLKYLI
ncbi:MAG: hypothetical protein KDA88_14285 [Planctomycetaceae bacterium]|nr:hypothetical protein [Planctomycetaceae bacterium]MCB9949567.1 hypothetical protein [Planctomycetaceae bacterium]